MHLQINEVAGNKVVAIEGRLDTTTYADLEKTLTNLFDEGCHNMILDCSAMDYVSSSGLRVFLMILKKIKSVGGSLVLCGLQPAIYNVFEISGFLSIFSIRDSLDQALNK
ncbi:MAG TPA: anti-sigma factor antagonist [Bacteroidales bacterium]|nr:MAG: hypothetical protein A2X11_03045 [Bacteroidetes bacterium GWE2_42_24]OFY28410.1 MAG: hypothetical protein A2X09_15000 [Bacteroidetes bacterium GWF2_43_11]HAQ65347.1 anti-sigma factor antagonist [Bacteroidales bacterium]HBZ65462.1 anti-sigma factor antagonist [Bacteroidales bacterium]